MAEYFGRVYRIEYLSEGGQVLLALDSRDDEHPLQVEFSIEVTFGAAISMMELSVFNLSKDSIGQIRKATRIRFSAGYHGAFGPIFYGKVSNMATPRVGTDVKTTVWCWSGLRESFDKLCQVSYAPGEAYSTIVDFVAGDFMGKPPEYVGFGPGFREAMGIATDGYNASQPHKTILSNLAEDLQFEWLIQNERCLLMQRGASRGGAPYEISPETGLSGGVSLTWSGADFEMRLDPRIQIGDRVVIRAEMSSINFSQIYSFSLPEEKTVIGDGVYVVKALRRKGSFYSDNGWTTALTCWREGVTRDTDGPS